MCSVEKHNWNHPKTCFNDFVNLVKQFPHFHLSFSLTPAPSLKSGGLVCHPSDYGNLQGPVTSPQKLLRSACSLQSFGIRKNPRGL